MGLEPIVVPEAVRHRLSSMDIDPSDRGLVPETVRHRLSSMDIDPSDRGLGKGAALPSQPQPLYY